MQIDFAENYSTFYQDKIQSAHWHKTQVSVFTTAFWQCRECMFVSDDLSHSKESMLIFLDTLLTSLLQSDTKILHVGKMRNI